jgi:thiol-disulfide isomerase/thioredoxin
MTRAGRALGAAILSVVLAGSVPVPARAAGVVLGQPAPDFKLTTLDGKAVTLADYRGKTLVINVWGSWCPPCRIETPDLVAEAKADGAQVAFLGIDTTETASVARAFTAAKGVTYPQVVTTADSAFARDYDIRNYPTTIVIDPQGVVRARHADNLLPRPQLHAYITAAQRGESAPLVSGEQRKLDAMLDPARFPFTGDPATVRANVAAAAKAIAAADDEMDDAMTDAARDHDLIRTRAEQSALRDAAIAAFEPLAQSDADRVLLADLHGDQLNALGDWTGADHAYAQALAIDPKDVTALSGQAYAASKRGDDVEVAVRDLKIAQVAPSYSHFIAVARIEAKLGHHDSALSALDRAIALATATKSPAKLAWTHLYGGRAAIALGDTARAKVEFAAALATAEKIPPGDSHFTMYVEQAQEATIALGLGEGRGPVVSLAPWTGADLPGSIASTYKYRLAVAGKPGSAVDLHASGLPKYWIASFCTDKVCAPFHVVTTIPATGVRVIEFQVVPDDEKDRRHPTVHIDAKVGTAAAATSAVVS